VSRKTSRAAARPHPASPPVRAPRPASGVAPLPFSHPALWLAVLAAAAAIVLSVSFRLYEKDMWQHIAVGRALWQLHEVPRTQVWIWPTYGQPDVTPSWLFRALLWPVWEQFGVAGLFAWRWIGTLLVFGLGWATARRMGARGLTPLLAMSVCALTYRQRSQIRPETLAAVLMAIELWILERHRRAGGGRALLALPVIAWTWANAHISYPLGLAMTSVYAVTALLERARPGGATAARRLAAVLLAQIAITFLHPGGLAALAQPFQYMLAGRDEPIMKTIPELYPVSWASNLSDLLPLALAAWLVLALRWWRRRGFDLPEIALVGGAVALALPSQRFLGFAMIVLAPFLARDLDDWIAARRWPAWTAPPFARAGLVAAACAASGIAEWSRSDLPIAIAYDWKQVPIRACDYMERENVGGRGFNPFYFGGYMLYRFWPERDRLPFMDIHQSGTALDRYMYAFVPFEPRAWRDLDTSHHFDYVLWRRRDYGAEKVLDRLDADSSFALVFVDDAAALYVRREGHLAPLARRDRYAALPAGPTRWTELAARAGGDVGLSAILTAELTRAIQGSAFHAIEQARLDELEKQRRR
jgi:hypothetical protein